MRLPAILGAAAVVLAGCAHSVAGVAVSNPAQGITPLRADDTDQVLIGPAQLRDIVGVRLQTEADQSRPIPGSSAVPACSALDAAGMAAFLGDQSLGLHVLLFTDGDRHDHVVAEAVAIYPDAGAAAAQFAAGTKNAKACDGQRALSTGGDAAWKFTVPEINADTVRWSKQQIGIPFDWTCYAEARLRNNAIVQAMACQGDDGGQVTVTRMTDRMSASVWELSGR
ncbi:sensor domain-containing protein [Mycobacterium sp. CVI_P3]|uniref:Sensor domain-containing protein n=1 Tax=Mycobacterium pinniadriaticum TaxID=2994102 RepID=A0ABT3SKS2_9MYCO|nr:sensor domain-containing protein [Mycobacterium pinniadriaticum]MCX2933670.1 sensor domain-containing protein [Mycobacterium pinniadriaticum]MCX2940043.1 sensor domain-containing protein [Mycobacterium pinniadriaticum]